MDSKILNLIESYEEEFNEIADSVDQAYEAVQKLAGYIWEVTMENLDSEFATFKLLTTAIDGKCMGIYRGRYGYVYVGDDNVCPAGEDWEYAYVDTPTTIEGKVRLVKRFPQYLQSLLEKIKRIKKENLTEEFINLAEECRKCVEELKL
jgi:hypothetical protein